MFGAASLADAAWRDNRQEVLDLIKQGADVNQAQGDGMTALHWAASHGEADLVQTLIYAGANVKATTRINGYTPLFLASEYGHTAVIEALIKAHANPNAVSTVGSTPLMLAAASGRVEAVKALLDAQADVNARESGQGESPLMFAAAYNRGEVIRVLAQRGADLNATAAVRDLYAVTRDGGIGRAAGKGPGGRLASGGGRQTDPKKAQIPGVDRPYQFAELVGYEGGLTPMLFAAREGHLDAVRALIDAGANVNGVSAGDKTSALLIASINGQFDLAKLLLDKGADPNLAAENGVAPLYAVEACQWAALAFYPQPRAYLQQTVSYLDLMKGMLDNGADPNLRLMKKVWYSEYNHDESQIDESGATVFWRAAYAGDVDAMRLLVAHGADPNVGTIAKSKRRGQGYVTEQGKDLSGLPAVIEGGVSISPLVAAAGVGYGRGAGTTHTHSLAGWMPAVQYLVEEIGADVNARDDGGDSPLHYAAARGDNEMIQYLIAKGANVKAVNRVGQSVADLANGPTERGVRPFPETLKLLEQLGVKPNFKCTLCS
jgi:ankyrin repeat protein